MVICAVVECKNRSDRGPNGHRNLCPNRDGEHKVSFYRIPAISYGKSKLELEL